MKNKIFLRFSIKVVWKNVLSFTNWILKIMAIFWKSSRTKSPMKKLSVSTSNCLLSAPKCKNSQSISDKNLTIRPYIQSPKKKFIQDKDLWWLVARFCTENDSHYLHQIGKTLEHPHICHVEICVIFMDISQTRDACTKFLRVS